MNENPPILGPGWDFSVFWNVGRAILHGANPYTVFGSYYPPLTSYLFVIFAVMPQAVALALWTAANVFFLVRLCRGRSALAWVLFFPTLMVFAAGQIDLAFVWAASYLNRKDWKSVAAAVAITLKPQLALVLLPYWLFEWATRDRRRLVTFGVTAGAVHALPLLWNASLLSAWMSKAFGVPDRYVTSPGIWSLGAPPSLTWLLVLAALGLGLAALQWAGSEHGVRSAVLLSMPLGQTYDLSTLTGAAPAWLLVPLSWAALGLAHLTRSFGPFALLPAAVLVYRLIIHWRWERRFRRELLGYPAGQFPDAVDAR